MADMKRGALQKTLQCPLRLSINREMQENGKEGCARGTQEGCPAPFKSVDFRTFESSEILSNLSKRIFRQADASQTE